MHAPVSNRPSAGFVLLLGALTAFAAMSVDMYLPSLPSIERSLGTSAEAVQRTVSVFLLGLAVGQLVYGPLSDRVGRRVPLLVGCAIYVAASIGCALATSVELLTLGRLFQGLGGCAGMVISRAVVRDRFDHQETARIFSMLTLVMGVAPIVAPFVGGLLLELWSWRAIFLALALFGTVLGLSVLLRLPESRSAAVADQARSETPLKSYFALLRQRQLLGYALVGAFNGACLFTYISASPDLIINQYGIPPERFGMVFGVNAAGLIGASQVNRALLRRFTSAQILAVASPAALAAGLLLLAGAASGTGGMWGVLVPLFFVMTSQGFMQSNAIALALDVDPLRAGSISALLGAAGFGTGVLASVAASALHDGTAMPMASVMVAALLLSALSLFGLARPKQKFHS